MKFLKSAILTVIAVLLTSCVGDGTNGYRRFEGAVWATTFHITYRSDRMLDDSIHAVMMQVEKSLSPFAESSLISAINRGETDRTDSLIRRIFMASQDINRRSGGAFDPTVAPLVNLWGFGYRSGDGAEPSQAAIDSALTLVGIGRCRLEAGRIVKVAADTEFNFSAITKGYGADLVGEMLRRNGCTDYMVEIGGEIALSGVNPRGEDWHVMIDAPVSADTAATLHERMAVIYVTDGGVATSGNYRNFRDTSRGRVGHTINPVTGYPVTTSTLSATVIAPNAMAADALATACMAMPADSALRMIEEYPGAEAMLVTEGKDGGWNMRTTSRFPEIRR
ncbi:MAG: FAD:protein FMN transferase [Muribaculaceae bacterium]|nr:FAD:protein FMN transferase [Muribaculaceae bacterium]